MEENYYEKLLNDIALCIQQGDYQSARDLVDGELKMPYVPSAVMAQLQEHRKNLDALLRPEKPVSLIDPGDLHRMLAGDGQQATNAIRSLQNANVRNYLEQIRMSLKDGKIHHLLKVMVLEVLISQKVDDQFEFERDGMIITVDPANLPRVADQPVFGEVMEALEVLLAKNPSFLQQAQILALEMAYDLFPALLEKEKVSIYTYSIIRYLYGCYGENEQWKQFAVSQNVDESELMELSF